jgi:hypothetical protein
VKIRGTCKRDGRDFMVEQVVEAGGECPWDGEPFNADYAATLVDALERVELAGTAFEEALRTIADLHPEFTLHEGSALDPIREQLARLEQRLVRRG